MITVQSQALAAIDLDELKSFVRVDGDDHDALLGVLAESALQEAFNISHCCFGEATIQLERWERFGSIQLPYYPLKTVTEVLLDGVAAVEGTDYTIEGRYINILTDYEESIKITYTVGTTLPADVKGAVYQRVKYQYDFGDDLPYPNARYFDNILARYRDPLSVVG